MSDEKYVPYTSGMQEQAGVQEHAELSELSERIRENMRLIKTQLAIISLKFDRITASYDYSRMADEKRDELRHIKNNSIYGPETIGYIEDQIADLERKAKQAWHAANERTIGGEEHE